MPLEADNFTDTGEQLQEFLDEYEGARLITSSIILIVLTTCLMSLQFLSGKIGRKGRKWFLDDTLLLVSYICFITLCAIMIVMVAVAGMGRHVYALQIQNPGALEMFNSLVTPSVAFLFAAHAFSRLAILSLYLRVSKWQPGGLAHTTTVLLMVLVIINFILSVSISSTVCRPEGFVGDITVPNGDCDRYFWYYRSQMFIGILFDFVLMALPWKTIWTSPMAVNKRMTVVVFFSFASIGITAWVIKRVVVMYGNAPWIDGTFSSIPLNIWYSTEGGYFIMINCLSRLRPLMLVVLPERVVSAWKRAMTSLGQFVRAPDTGEVLPMSTVQDQSSIRGGKISPHSPINEHREWDEQNTGQLQEIDLGLSRTRTKGHHPVSLSFMEDPYMLGPNSRTIGVSSWTIVGPSTDIPMENRHRGGASGNGGGGEIQVTVEVSMRTNPRTKSWAHYEEL